MAVESCFSESVPVFRGEGGGPVCVSTGALAISAIYSVHLYVPDTPNTSRRVFTITLH